MGLFDFIRNELIEVIEYLEKDKDIILWKYPDKDRNIKYGADLNVMESQIALFVDEGIVVEVCEPGSHKLITDNWPFITKLKSWKRGFKSPFKADVYYISQRTFTGLKWGTPNPIMLRDPQFKQVRVRAFGTYFIKVKDPRKFFTEYAGTSSVLRASEIERSLRDIVSPKFAEALAEAQVSVLDMVANYTELGDKIAPILQKDLDPFGIELVKFQITSTSMPAEVEKFYDKMTNMNMVDNMNKFQQFQTSNAIEKMSENPGGGGNDGLNIGVGMGMANMFMNQMQKNQQQQPQNQQPQMTRAEVIKTLKELGELKDMGILTIDEFNGKKKELLARI